MRTLNKRFRPKAGDAFTILGYRGDKHTRPVRLDRVSQDGHLFVCECLLRSSPSRKVYRSYDRRFIEGIRPLVATED